MKRTLTGLAAALVLAVVLTVALTAATGWSPICLILEEGSIAWYAFGCNIDPPVGDPQG